MIGLSTLTFDLDGHVLLHAGVKTQEPIMTRRVSRTATLDGSSVLSDLGFSDSDGTYFLSFQRITQAQIESLKYLIQNYNRLMLCSKNGAFEGVLSVLDMNELPIKATFLIEKKVSE